MPHAAKPHNENIRLKSLEAYNILDTSPEVEYDEIASLASIICDTPIALVCLVDSERQWFKSKKGLDADETHRDMAFCAHAILNPDKPLIVEDATKDPRFSDNPLVINDPNIRFYAGYPLNSSDGYPIGTLCTIDRKPKKLDESQIEALRILTKNIVHLLELRKSKSQLEQSNEELDKFAYVASHDLKAPLRIIDSLSYFLESEKDLSNEGRNNLHKLRSRITKMGALLDDLLEYSSIGRKMHSYENRLITGHELAIDLKDLLSPRNDFQIEFTKNFLKTKISRMPIQHILLNLIDNAIKHHDKKNGSVLIDARDCEEGLEFSIKDDGPGIAAEFHEKIFEIFQRLPNKDVDGKGMGLAMVKRYIENQGGSIKLSSDKNRGAEFVFTMPKYQTEYTEAV